MSSFTFFATRPPDKPSEEPLKPLSFRDKVLGVQQPQVQHQDDESLQRGRVSSSEVNGGGTYVNDGTEANCVPRVELEGGAYSLHGEWLNVTRKKRGKSGGKSGSYQDVQKQVHALTNKFAALGMENNVGQDNMDGSVTVTGAKEQAQLFESKGGSRKKRSCMGQQSTIDVRKLLDNAAKDRVHMADRVTTRVAKGVDGEGTSGLKGSTTKPIEDSCMRLSDQVSGPSGKYQPSSKGKGPIQHPFRRVQALDMEMG
ncbi:hypothetical protein SESBI_06442 [Sesbania bispinosa]|nr:hypothetical protein SESBI_06442 [Sesbania bispinosa]